MDEVIHRQIWLLSRHICAPIEIVSGSQIPIRLEIMDYTIPVGAIAKVYATIHAEGPVYIASGTVLANTVTFTPPDGFFTPGRNRMQLELNYKIIPLSLEVICQSRVSLTGDQATPEVVTPLTLRAETAANSAEASAGAAAESASSAQASAQNASSSKTASAKSATAAANSSSTASAKATEAANSATAAANSATAASSKAADATNSAKTSASWAIGGTGTRTGEDTDNSKYYSQQSQSASNTASAKASEAAASANAAGNSNTAAQNAKTAAENAKAAAQAAATAASGSATAAENSKIAVESVAVKTPYVGDSGNWMVWDQAAGKFVDSGIKAQGEKGDTGPQGEPGVTGAKGATGAAGTNAYIHIRYAAQQPSASAPTISTIPDAWMGIYSGTASTAPTSWSEYQWYNIKGTTGATGPQGEQGPEGATGPQGEQGPKGEKGDTGAAAVLTSSSVTYQMSDSGTIVPSGDWSSTIPSAVGGQYLWTRITTVYNTGDPVVAYSVARMGIDGNGSVSSVAGISPDESGNVSILNIVYPVGAIYLSTVATSPAAIFGGTWERIQNRFLLAAGNDYAAGSQGGEAAHALTVNEMPSHTHGMGKRLLSWDSSDPNKLAVARDTASPLSIYTDYSQVSKTSAAGGGSAHNNMPPYLAVYVWKRTA